VLSASKWKERCYSGGFSGYDRVILEFCCEVDSAIGKAVDNGCIAVRFTKQDDLTSVATIKLLRDILEDCEKHKLRVLLWSAIPCTGGCPFQEINKNKGEATREKIAGHWKLFRKLWATLKSCGEIVLRQGGIVAIEWPNRCRYWNEGDVRKFVAKHSLSTAHVHACEYGMQSIKDKSKYLQKIWHVKTSSQRFADGIHKKRSGGHDHITIESADTEPSGKYPVLFAQAIYRSFKQVVHQRFGD